MPFLEPDYATNVKRLKYLSQVTFKLHIYGNIFISFVFKLFFIKLFLVFSFYLL